MMTRNGSVPAFVMRSGMFQPMSPRDARRDITMSHVDEMTDMNARTALYADRPEPSVAQTVTAVPPQPIQTPPSAIPSTPSGRHGWHTGQRRVHPAVADIKRLHPNAQLHGAEQVELGEWQGRPVAQFQIQSTSSPMDAQASAAALRRAALAIRSAGLSYLPPELIAGPLAALLRGGAVALHFQNGVVIRTAL